jgi:Zn-dependent protease
MDTTAGANIIAPLAIDHYNQRTMLNLAPSTVISRIITLVIAFSFHEFAHAWTANAFGDDTPRMNGRLTLNPFRHLDIMGTLLLIVAGFGWAKPVPINPSALRRRSSSAVMWVSIAGPFANFVLALIAAIPIRLGWVPFAYDSSAFMPTLWYFLAEFILINLTLMLFNLIPLSPLDGEKVLEFFLPPKMAETYEKIRPYGPVILLAVVFLLPLVGVDLIGAVLYPAQRFLLNLLIGASL